MALVLDSGDGALSLPVDVAIGLLIEPDVVSLLFWNGYVAAEGLLLLVSPVRQMVVGQGKVLLSGVAFLNLELSQGEMRESLHELLDSVVLLAPLSQVVHVLNLNVREGRDGACG